MRVTVLLVCAMSTFTNAFVSLMASSKGGTAGGAGGDNGGAGGECGGIHGGAGGGFGGEGGGQGGIQGGRGGSGDGGGGNDGGIGGGEEVTSVTLAALTDSTWIPSSELACDAFAAMGATALCTLEAAE